MKIFVQCIMFCLGLIALLPFVYVSVKVILAVCEIYFNFVLRMLQF